MNVAALALRAAEARLVTRLEDLARKIDAGDERAWRGYIETAAALAAILPQAVPGATGEALDTATMAQRLGITPKVLRRKAAAGQLEGVQPIRLGKRGPSALRWVAAR